MGGTFAVFVVVLLLVFARARRRRRRMAEAWAQMVNPSDEYAEEHSSDANDYGDYLRSLL